MSIFQWVRHSDRLFSMMWAGFKERWEDDSTVPRRRIASKDEFQFLGTLVIGILYIAFWIAALLAMLYGLVQFVKWA
jgi:hypothetical protein